MGWSLSETVSPAVTSREVSRSRAGPAADALPYSWPPPLLLPEVTVIHLRPEGSLKLSSAFHT